MSKNFANKLKNADLMDLTRHKTLFDVIAEGDDVSLQRLLLEGKEERNVATLAVSETLYFIGLVSTGLKNIFFLARKHTFARSGLERL